MVYNLHASMNMRMIYVLAVSLLMVAVCISLVGAGRDGPLTTSELVAIVDVSSIADDGLLRTFQEWMVKHNKVWKNAAEMALRLEAFIDNHNYIETRNQRLMHEDGSYCLGLNSFAHLTYEEFRQAYLQTGGYVDHHAARHRRGQQLSVAEMQVPAHKMNSGKQVGFMYENATDIPQSVDWRARGALTSVKDQGQCGSCWAFSSVAAVEAAHQIATDKLVSLSEQELVDCDRAHNMGCNGGLMDYAFEFIIANRGLDTEADYPYKASSGRCNMRKRNVHAVTIDDYEDVPESDEQALLKAVAHQPVSVAIDAGGRDFQLYSGGVFTGSCGKRLNHAVVAVGYGKEDKAGGQEYWIVRNSWGEGWGEGGYVRMARTGSHDADGLCGINMEPSFPVIRSAAVANYLRLPSQKLEELMTDHSF